MNQKAWNDQATLLKHHTVQTLVKVKHNTMEVSRLSKTGQHSGTMSSSIDSTNMNYNLNITRAIQKKLEATKRKQHVEYRYTSRDVVTADTATFELIRIASIHYFEATQGNKDVIHIRKYTDKSNSTVVQYTITSKQPESGYTVNIYIQQPADSWSMEKDGNNL